MSNKKRSRRTLSPSYILIQTFAILSALFISTGVIFAEEQTSFSILDAQEKGFFNMGPALGDVVSAKEESANKEVLKFDYTIFNGALVGVWTKSFPSDIRSDMVDAVRVGLKASNPEQLKQVSVKLEIKGNLAMQSVRLRLGSEWSYAEEAVDWNKIGPLKEVVFVVSPMDASKRLDGILYFDLNFKRLTPLQNILHL